jgi:hypothetical protein
VGDGARGRLCPVIATAAGPSGRAANLVIDGHGFAGLTAPEATADQLVRFARARQVRGAGASRVGSVPDA